MEIRSVLRRYETAFSPTPPPDGLKFPSMKILLNANKVVREKVRRLKPGSCSKIAEEVATSTTDGEISVNIAFVFYAISLLDIITP